MEARSALTPGVRRRSRSARLVASAAIALLVGCADTPLPSSEFAATPVTPSETAAGRVLIVPVSNNQTPLQFVVAEWDGRQRGDIVGSAHPDTVPPMARGEVTLLLPPGDDWAVFSNKQHGRLLFTSGDLPSDFSGRLPFRLEFDGEGFLVGIERPPGWFEEP